MKAPARESRLASILDERRDEILRRFIEYAKKSGAAEALPPAEIINSLGVFLEELATGLRAGDDRDASLSPRSKSARDHGVQRFALGYDAPAIVREYAALRELLWDIIEAHGTDVQAWEIRVLFTCLFRGVEGAVDTYTHAHEAALRDQASRHIGFLAHELRNPLSSARMALGLLQERGDLKPSKAGDALARGLARLTNLIDDSLVRVRLENIGHLDCETFDVDAFLLEISEESTTDAESKGVALRVNGGSNGVMKADPKALRSAVSNLVRNAVKFTRPGGEVHVRGRAVEGRIIIEVEDGCGGLPEGKIQKLFDPFVQVGSDRSGFGLGLAIAKQAAEAHGGHLRVHNLPGKGCAFVLDLPEKATTCAADAQRTSRRPPA